MNWHFLTSIVFPEGYDLPLVVQTLSKAAGTYPEIVKWLAGGWKRANGEMFEPKDQNEKMIQDAAKLILPMLPAKK